MSEKEKNTSYLKLTQGKINREDLFTIIYYATVDPFLKGNWASVLGEKTFVNWLRLLTLVDRSDAAPVKYGNDMTVPRSLESLAKVLGMSKPTLYKQVIKPLWNHGLIDLEEWHEQKKIGTKALNIIVYLYPQNNPNLKGQPLERVRDYDKDYHSQAKVYAQKRTTTSQILKDEHAASLESPAPVQDYAGSEDVFMQLRHKVKNQHLIILEFLNMKNMPVDLIQQTIELLKPIDYEFAVEELKYQFEYMQKIIKSDESIYDLPKFFINGLVMRHENKDNLSYEPFIQLDIDDMMRVQSPSQSKRVPFYNWLEERE